MIQALVIATSSILPGTGRGTMRSMGEGQVVVGCDGWGGGVVEAMMFDATLPLHQLRWFPSPFRGGFHWSPSLAGGGFAL